MSIVSEITRLQNAKASIKAAIEDKGITVPCETKLEGYAELIEGISGGGDASSSDMFGYITNVTNLFANAQFANPNVVVDFHNNVINASSNGIFYCTNARNLEVKNLTILGKSMESFCLQPNTAGSVIELITLTNCQFAPTSINSFCRYASTLTAIYGEIDMSNCTNMTACFEGCTTLSHVEFKPNSISINTKGLNSSPFDRATLVNIANALKANISNRTVTLSENSKAVCSAIRGDNVDGTFVIRANGSMTLTGFITNVKGWTLA